MSLLTCYQEIFELTKAQAKAIAEEDWDALPELIDRRGRTIQAAEPLVSKASEAEKAEATRLLAAIRKIDAASAKAMLDRKETLAEEISQFNSFNNAVDGYHDSFHAVANAKFFDGNY